MEVKYNPNLKVAIAGLTLENPVCAASGTFGYGAEYEDLVDLSKLGAIFTKAVTLENRCGNAIPRIVETPSGLLNSIGLANPGIDAFISDKLPKLKEMKCAVFVNVAGKTEDEYAQVLERLDSLEGISGFEINVSCPNVKHGGLAFGTNPHQVEALTHRLRHLTKKPLIIKLTPNVTDITEVAKAAESGGADALSCINTLIGMVIDIKKQKPVLGEGSGGLSGPAIKPVGVACVHRVFKAVKIPIFGLGGIMCASDAIEYLLAGASALQIGTGNFVDPKVSENVLSGIIDYMNEYSISNVKGFHNRF